jgi:hypothetical protein
MESLVTFIHNYPTLIKAGIVVIGYFVTLFLRGPMVNFTVTLVIAYILKYVLQLLP